MNGRGSRLKEEIEIIPLGWVIASLIAFFAVQVLFWVVKISAHLPDHTICHGGAVVDAAWGSAPLCWCWPQSC